MIIIITIIIRILIMVIIRMVIIMIKKFAGPWAHRRVRSLVSSLGRCVVVSRPRKEGAPRALGGQSRGQAAAPTPGQSPSASWRPVICEGFFRRNQKTSLKCRDWSRRSTSNFETAFFKKVSNLKTFFLRIFCRHRGGHGTL